MLKRAFDDLESRVDDAIRANRMRREVLMDFDTAAVPFHQGNSDVLFADVGEQGDVDHMS